MTTARSWRASSAGRRARSGASQGAARTGDRRARGQERAGPPARLTGPGGAPTEPLPSGLVSVDVELARRQWEEAQRRVDAAAREPVAQERLHREIEAVSEELRRRVGATFTLAELAAVYAE